MNVPTTVTKPRDQRAWRLVFSRIQEAADAVNRGAKARGDREEVQQEGGPQGRGGLGSGQVSNVPSGFRSQVQWRESEKVARQQSHRQAWAVLNLKDAAVAARNEQHRLEVLERRTGLEPATSGVTVALER